MQTWQRRHFMAELAIYGVEFIEFNPTLYKSRDELAASLNQFLLDNVIDLFFTSCGSDLIYYEILSLVRSHSIPSLLICYDNLLIPYEHLKISKYFDLVWLTSLETESLFIKAGAKSIFLPYASNPNILQPRSSNPVKHILFIGNPYGSRANLINDITSSGIHLDLYSKSDAAGLNSNTASAISIYDRFVKFKNYIRFPIGRRIIYGAFKQKFLYDSCVHDSRFLHRYPSLDFDGMYSAYSNYTVSLSSIAARNTGVLHKPVNVVNLRSFEIPMAGGLQFCAYSEELANYFEDKKEIIFYHSRDEMINLLKYLNSKNAESRVIKIKENARTRAVAEHSWKNRFSVIFSFLGLNKVFNAS